MLTRSYIKSIDEIRDCKEEIILFLSRSTVVSNLYHQPTYIEKVLKAQSEVIDWRLVVLKLNQDIVAIFPLYVQKESFRVKLGLITLLSLKLRVLKSFGHSIAFDVNLSENILYAALEEVLTDFSGIYDIGLFEAVPSESAMLSYFSFSSKFLRMESVFRNHEIVRLLEFTGSWSEYIGAMKRKRRYNLNACVKKMEEKSCGDLKVLRYRTVNDVTPFLCDLNDIYHQTWQSNVFGSKDRNNDLELDKNHALAELGAFNCFVLQSAGEAIAYLRGYSYKGIYYYEEIGYKQLWREYNPGSVLNMLAIQRLFSDGNIKSLNFGYGENTYKQIFGNASYSATNVALVKKKSLGLIVVRMQQCSQLIYNCIHKVLVALELDVKIRALLKRGSRS